MHILGIGKTGAAVIAKVLNDQPKGFLSDPKTRFTALAVDIGDADLVAVRQASGKVPADRSQVRTVSLPVPSQAELMTSLNRWREYLKMEYPRYYWNPNYEPWLPSDVVVPTAGEHFPRALAKSIYGSEYYQNKEIATALEDFAKSVFTAETTPLVCVVFSLAGGGSGIAVEISRHLSSIKLGRRPWVVGIGVMPCEGDSDELKDGRFFPSINEIDCMVDAEKNRGVMAVWGDLYKNPFTGGFFAVPQDEVFALTGDLAATHAYVDAGIASFISRDNGVHLYETLKALNWLSVPQETWHPAIRGELGERWINILTSRLVKDAGTLGNAGLRPGFATEYVEARVFSKNGKVGAALAATAKEQLGQAADARIEPGVLQFESDDQQMVHYIIPRASKLDLEAFVPAREAYDKLSWDEKLMIHAWLLDLGVMLCEPSIRFDGMGGECIWGCACWVVVPHAAIRGETVAPKIEALTL